MVGLPSSFRMNLISSLHCSMDFSWAVPYPLGFRNANPGKPSTSNSTCLLYGKGPFNPVASSINK